MKQFRLATKFNLAMIIIFAISTTVIYFVSSYRLRKGAEERIAQRARMLLVTMESSRKFTGDVIKPKLYAEIPDKFILEGMSSSFMAQGLFNVLKHSYPDYYFKHASPVPRNPINKSDEFETEIIQKFNEDPSLEEWQGYRINRESQEYIIMKPIRHEQICNKCHGNPEETLPEIIEQYGAKAAFYRKDNEVIAALTVSVPATLIINEARQNTLVFISVVMVFFLVLGIAINLMISRLIARPIKELADVANRASLGELDIKININRQDEIGELAAAFERMKLSIQKALNRLKNK